MTISTDDFSSVKPFVGKFSKPEKNSHKGQNGRVLIIGGSSLFHSASLWAAEIASYFVDMVHYSSTKENNQIFLNLKSKFQNGIVVSRKDLLSYAAEDDTILVGPGMIRKIQSSKFKNQNFTFHEICNLQDEGEYTYYLTKFLIENFPEKQFVFDAGSLQMMNKEWLLKLKKPAIVTPHQKEFESLFGVNVAELDIDQKMAIVKKMALEYKTIILLKAIDDLISDGTNDYRVVGGNAGLTKGGTGDLLAGLVAALSANNPPLLSATLASIVLKSAADGLFLEKGSWYNIGNLMTKIPETMHKLTGE